jgi:hypothetical protein
LRRHLHLLRQVLPEGEWILTGRETLQWNPAADTWLDVTAFVTALENCPPPSPDALEKCLALYQGDLLPELYEDWLIPHRETLRAKFFETMHRALAASTAQRDYPAALRLARHLLTHDPLHEDLHCTLMRLHALAGDRQAAFQQFETCKATLYRELDLAPAPATLALHRQILDNTLPDLPPTPARAAPADAPPAPLPSPAGPASASLTTLNPRRRWLWPGLIALAAFTLVLVLFFRPRPPLHTFVINTPTRIQDTWLAETFPDDLYWPEDPEQLPHAHYTRTHLQFYGTHAPDRVLIRFDLGGLPAQAQIESATFAIHLDAWVELEATHTLTQAMPAEASVFQLLTPWQAEQATFNAPWTQPGLGAGVDYLASPLDTQPIENSAWLQFDVTQAARTWWDDPSSNQGVMLIFVAAAHDQAHYWVDMADQATPALRPSLTLTYR